MSCPRLSSVLASSSSSSTSSSPYKSSGPCKPESLLGEIPSLVQGTQTRLDGRFEESGQVLTNLRFYRYRPKGPWIWTLRTWCQQRILLVIDTSSKVSKLKDLITDYFQWLNLLLFWNTGTLTGNKSFCVFLWQYAYMAGWSPHLWGF